MDRVSWWLAVLVALLVGCTGEPGVKPPPAPSPTPNPTRTPVSVTLPADWDLPFPKGVVIQAVNWGEREPGHDRVQLALPIDTDGVLYFKEAFKVRGLTVTERATDGSAVFLEAEGEPGRERFGVMLPRSGVVLVDRWRPVR